ncbi:MAG: YbhB/YbcL family Raf kinase inhibitor-like protein [Ignavibacteria bacterium]|nr:YbhB/YbcL family Raf kinase inhibitor-like protein [Ignavibacteria bacterium]
MKLVCRSYQDKIPLRYAHLTVQGGKNISPAFTWTDPPHETKSFVFSIVDPHPVADNWVHWLVVNIPFNIRELKEGASRHPLLPAAAVELYNSYGEKGYGGPAPPPGSGPHPYVATLYALGVETIKPGRDSLLNQVLRTIDGTILAETSVTGFYER